ncbi:31129_t:CDS:2 [Gigaspora margarita]|uniref:31129_t:CDS:1 n=1 Tax=Gigaspora margarita TaxID=4874 RepID=A0ABM8W6S1_GIGMA|nr:31129_t:CDS:2 [Gigaspora margarita]
MNKTIHVVSTVAKILALYSPVVGTINIIAREIYDIYENAESNKEICKFIVNRVPTVEFAINTMMRNIEDNKEKFQEKNYFLAFERFKNALTNIKNYTNKVLKFSRYKNFFNAIEVKNKYQKLTEEYDACIRDLGIAIAISDQNDKFIEAKKVDKVLNNTEKTFEKLDYADHKFDALAKYIEIIKEFIKYQINKPENDIRGHIVRRLYNENDSKYVLQFYGLSNIDNNKVIVFEWNEHGTLIDFYNTHDIPWTRKI